MSPGEKIIQNAKEIRQRLRFPPNAVFDPGIDLTRKSTACKGDIPPPNRPVKKPLALDVFPQKPVIVFPISLDDIIKAVAEYYGPSPDSIKGASRMAILCHARRVVVYLALKILHKASVSSIARGLNKDHTPIIFARRRINAKIISNPELLSELNKLEQIIVDNHRSSISAIG